MSTEQVTVTLVTSSSDMVPVPLETVQVCPSGCVFTVTLYVEASAMAVEKVNVPSEVIVRSSPPLF